MIQFIAYKLRHILILKEHQIIPIWNFSFRKRGPASAKINQNPDSKTVVIDRTMSLYSFFQKHNLLLLLSKGNSNFIFRKRQVIILRKDRISTGSTGSTGSHRFLKRLFLNQYPLTFSQLGKDYFGKYIGWSASCPSSVQQKAQIKSKNNRVFVNSRQEALKLIRLAKEILHFTVFSYLKFYVK